MRARGLSVLLSLIALACTDGGSVAELLRPSGERRSGNGILVIAIDSLRADHLSSYGYDRETSPVLDGLAAEGIVFTQAFSTAPWLLPAHVSIATGCDPYIALRPLPENIRPSMVTLWHIPDEAPRLSKEFLRNGYHTAAFSDHPWFAPVHGFRAGFQDFHEHLLRAGTRPSEVGIEGLSRQVEQWLRNRPRDRDWFAFVHLHDLERVWRETDPGWDTYFSPRDELSTVPPVGIEDHTYFAIPRRRWIGGLHTLGQYEAHYDGAIRRLDTALGRLFTRIKQMDRWETTTVVVVGTYGLGFGEEGIFLDHGALADVDLHVPLIVRPGVGFDYQRGLRTDALGSLIDVAPTLLDMRGLDVPVGMQGVSLTRAMRGESQDQRDFVLARCGFQAGYVIMDERWCYSRTFPWAVRDPALALSWYGNRDPDDQAPRVVLHDRRAEPDRPHLLAGPGDREISAALRRKAEDWLEQVESARRELNVLLPTPESDGDAGNWLPSGGSPGSPP
jgi:arylsulfatase A-like enzyme